MFCESECHWKSIYRPQVKVMFSEVSICSHRSASKWWGLFPKGGSVSEVDGLPPKGVCLQWCMLQGGGGLPNHPPVLISSGGTHPTVIHSCSCWILNCWRLMEWHSVCTYHENYSRVLFSRCIFPVWLEKLEKIGKKIGKNFVQQHVGIVLFIN